MVGWLGGGVMQECVVFQNRNVFSFLCFFYGVVWGFTNQSVRFLCGLLLRQVVEDRHRKDSLLGRVAKSWLHIC